MYINCDFFFLNYQYYPKKLIWTPLHITFDRNLVHSKEIVESNVLL